MVNKYLQSRPKTAITPRHVRKIPNDESIFVGIVGEQSHAVATRSIRIQDIGIVNTKVDLIAQEVDVAVLQRRGFRDIGHITTGEIRDLIYLDVSVERYERHRWPLK